MIHECYRSEAELYRNDRAAPGISGFLRDETGAASIEFVLWVPVFAFLLVAVIDATVLYLQHTEMWNVSRDVARRVAIGDMAESDVVQVVQNEMYLYSKAYTVATSQPTDPDVQIAIQTTVAEASVFGIFQAVMDEKLTAVVTMRREPI
ncbi:MAG: pilus assembly protein [Paracoccaceae bacterium]|nr:pilus assembly protein [Paracoccaceae bacterium]